VTVLPVPVLPDTTYTYIICLLDELNTQNYLSCIDFKHFITAALFVYVTKTPRVHTRYCVHYFCQKNNM